MNKVPVTAIAASLRSSTTASAAVHAVRSHGLLHFVRNDGSFWRCHRSHLRFSPSPQPAGASSAPAHRSTDAGARAVTQQALQPCAVGCLNAHPGIDREAAAVGVACHVFGVMRLQVATCHKGAQLNEGDRTQVQMGRVTLCRTGAMGLETLLHHAQEDAQRRVERALVALQVVAQAPEQRCIVGTVATLPALGVRYSVKAPALIMIGEAVGRQVVPPGGAGMVSGLATD